MSKHQAVAHREGRFWVVDVEGVGVTQGRNLVDAKNMAADLVTAMTGHDVAVDDVDLRVDVPVELQLEVEHARDAVRSAEAAQREAAILSRGVAAALKAAGFSGKDTAFVLGVSEQRVSQLTRP